jgi:hypothetical protein
MKVIDISYHLAASDFTLELRKTVASPYALVVPGDYDAPAAIRIAELNRLPIVVAVDPFRPENIGGILSLDWVKQQLRSQKGIATRSIWEAVQVFAQDPAEQAKNFRHEWLNANRPKLEWCAAGEHLTVLPCMFHS